MMINKRLIGIVPESKRYIAGNVAFQWLGIASHAAMIFSFAWVLQGLLDGSLPPWGLPAAAGVVVLAAVVRWLCAVGAGRMNFRAAKAVKQVLRRRIYEKLLHLGPAYSQKCSTAEAVQRSTEGVEHLETYFGGYLPQFFYSMPAPVTLFLLLSPVSLKAATALLVCVPLIPMAIAAVQTLAKRLLGKYWGQYTDLPGEPSWPDHSVDLPGRPGPPRGDEPGSRVLSPHHHEGAHHAAQLHHHHGPGGL